MHVITLLAVLVVEFPSLDAQPHGPPKPRHDDICVPGHGQQPYGPKMEDEQFELRAEIKLSKGKFRDLLNVVEYMDRRTRRGAVYSTEEDGTSRIWLYKFADDSFDFKKLDYSFLITENECAVPHQHSMFLAYDYMHSSKRGHITGPSRLFNDRLRKLQVPVPGNFTVREIPANRWTACVESMFGVTKVDYYYNKVGYTMPSGHSSIPLRVSVRGKKTLRKQIKEYSGVYDVIAYIPGKINDMSVFEVPRGVVCPWYQNKTRLPTSKSFSATVVMRYKGAHITIAKQMYVDHKAGLYRVDYNSLFNSREVTSHQLNVIHDHNTDATYIIDENLGNCTVGTRYTSQNTYAFPGPWDWLYRPLDHSSQIFDTSSFNLTYQGQRTERNTPCDLWAGRKIVGDEVLTVELYYAQEDWITEKDSHQKNRLVALAYYAPEMKESSESAVYDYVFIPGISHVYNYDDDVPDTSVFNIRPCYTRPNQVKRVAFSIVDIQPEFVRKDLVGLRQAVRKYVAAVSGVGIIRVNDIDIVAMVNAGNVHDTDVDVWLNILGPLPEQDTCNFPQCVSIDNALKALRRAINEDPKPTLTIANSKGFVSVPVKSGSFRTEIPSVQRLGYTSGAMTGLIFTMLTVGVIIGLAGAYTIWKKRIAVPYLIQ